MRFLCGIGRASPIADVGGFARFGDEAAHLRCQIGLSGIQSPAPRGGNVALRDAQTQTCLLLCGCGFFRCQLRCNLRSLGPRRVAWPRRSDRNMRAWRSILDRRERGRWRRSVKLEVRQNRDRGGIRRRVKRCRRHWPHRLHRGPWKCSRFCFFLGGAATENRG